MENYQAVALDPRYARLRECFSSGLAIALHRLRSITAGEAVYAIAVNPGDLYDAAFLYANTVAALPGTADELGLLSVKWNMADWAYQGFEGDALRPFNDEISAIIGDPYELDSDSIREHCGAMRKIYIDALLSDENAGLLSAHFRDRRPLVGLFLTDQSDDEMISFVEKLNLPCVAMDFRSELQTLRQLQHAALLSRNS